MQLREIRDRARDRVCVPPVYPGTPEQYTYHEYCSLKRRSNNNGANARQSAQEREELQRFVQPGNNLDPDRIIDALESPALLKLTLRNYMVERKNTPAIVAEMLKQSMRRRHPDPHERFDHILSQIVVIPALSRATRISLKRHVFSIALATMRA